MLKEPEDVLDQEDQEGLRVWMDNVDQEELEDHGAQEDREDQEDQEAQEDQREWPEEGDQEEQEDALAHKDQLDPADHVEPKVNTSMMSPLTFYFERILFAQSALGVLRSSTSYLTPRFHFR